MRKLTALAALSVFALPLAACGGEAATDDAANEASAMEEAAPAPDDGATAEGTEEGAVEEAAPADDRGMNPVER